MSIPPGAEQAFALAAGELGFSSASWLFVREAAAEGGDPVVADLRDALGRSFPVLDAVAEAWADGERGPPIDTATVIEAVRGASRLLIVGVEADHLDALIPRLDPEVDVALLCHSSLDANWDRVLANFRGRVRGVDFASFHAVTGAKSAALTFVYGTDGQRTHVDPAWLRLIGPDVRTQFRALVGWNVLHRPLYVYPRWLHEVPIENLTAVVGA